MSEQSPVTVVDGRPVLNNDQQAEPTASPTGAPLIPVKYTPHVIAGSAILYLLGEEMKNPAPWDGPRVIGVALGLLAILSGNISAGMRKK